jgi:hypothetical protein
VSLVWNLEIHHCQYKSLPLDPVLRHFDPVHITAFSKNLCNIIISTLWSPKWIILWIKTSYSFLISCECATCLSHLRSLYLISSKRRWSVCIMLGVRFSQQWLWIVLSSGVSSDIGGTYCLHRQGQRVSQAELLAFLSLMFIFGPTNAFYVVFRWLCVYFHTFFFIILLFMQHVSAVQGCLPVCSVCKLLYCINSLLKEHHLKFKVKIG